MARVVSAWSKRVGHEMQALFDEMNTDSARVADAAGLHAPTLRRQLEGTNEFRLGDFVAVANAVGYTPGGLLGRCLKGYNML